MKDATTDSLCTLVPAEYLNLSKCSYIFEKIEFLQDEEVVDCVICTSLGQLLEFRKKSLVGFCKLSSNTPKNIVPILTYDSRKHRYAGTSYVVMMSNESLNVVSRTPSLKVVHIEERATETKLWKVEDISNLGYPQLCADNGVLKVIDWSLKEQPVSSGIVQFCIPLQKALQNLRDQLVETQALLESKRKSRSTCINSEQDAPHLSVISFRFVLHHERIIVVVQVKNSGHSDSSMYGVRLLLMGSTSGSFSQFAGKLKLEKGEEACLVGVLMGKTFLPLPSIAVTYTYEQTKKTVSLPTPCARMTDQWVHELQLKPDWAWRELHPALTLGSGATQSLVVKVNRKELVGEQTWMLLEKALRQQLSFAVCRESQKIQLWRAEKSWSELGGTYIIADSSKDSLVLCCRNTTQLELLRSYVSSCLPEGAKLMTEDSFSTKPQDADFVFVLTKHIRNELSWISQHSCKKEMTGQFYADFLKELFSKCNVTDKSIPAQLYS